MDNIDNSDIEMLEKIPGITVSDGLEFCGGSSAFMKFLRTFCMSIDDKAGEIQQAYDNDDLDYYTIKVHALKSTARIIGAKELSELALKLEDAGRNRDRDYIEKKTGYLLELYRSYKDKLGGLLEKKDDYRTDISERELRDAYAALSEVIPAMDYDAVESILEELGTYRLPVQDQEMIDRLSGLLKNMDWDEMEELIKKGTVK